MPTAYCVRSSAINSVQTSEVRFTAAQTTNSTVYGSTYDWVGKDSAKIALDIGSNIQFDVSAVPLGAVVVAAGIYLTADANSADVFDSRIWRYKDGTTPNVDSTTETIHQQAQYNCRARDTASTQLGITTATVPFEHNVHEGFYGSDSVGQVLVLDTGGNGQLETVSMFMRRLAVPAPTGTCVAKVYEATGASGSYKKGTLLATSNDRDVLDLPSVFPFTVVEFEFVLPAPIAAAPGDVRIVEVSFSDTTAGEVFFGMDTILNGGAENGLSFGPSIQAFGSPSYIHGVEQKIGNGDRDAAGSASEGFVFPEFVAGDQYSLGDTLLSPDVTLTNFTSWVQDGLDARAGNDVLSFSFLPGVVVQDPDPPTSGQDRQWRSAEHATPQDVDGTDYYGPVLVVRYAFELAASFDFSFTIDAALTVEDAVVDLVAYLVEVSDPTMTLPVATAIVEAALANVTTTAQLADAVRTIVIEATQEAAQPSIPLLTVGPGTTPEAVAVPAATLTTPERSTEIAAAIVSTEIAAATADTEATVSVQDAALTTAVPAATMTVPLPTPSEGGPATEDTVAETLDISPVEVDIEVTKRDSKSFSFALTDEDGAALDLTNYDSFTLTVDPSEEPSDALSNLFQLDGDFSAPTTGIVTFSPTIVNHTQDPGEYFFDVEQIDDVPETRTIIKGKYTILPDITQT